MFGRMQILHKGTSKFTHHSFPAVSPFCGVTSSKYEAAPNKYTATLQDFTHHVFEGDWAEFVVMFMGDALTLMQLLFIVTDKLT